MPNDITTGMIWSNNIPNWQRTYFSSLLLETLRTKSILLPFCAVKEDPLAQKTGVVTYSEVYDTDPNFNPLTESSIWLKGASLDSRTVSIALAIYGDTLKFSDYAEIVQYLNNGDLKGLVREKIGQNQVDMVDLLARNAFLSHPNKVFAGGGRASRILIQQSDVFDPNQAELARTHLEELEVPGVNTVEDGSGPAIVCVTTPRVIHDIRTAAGSNWLEVQQYVGTARKFTSEVGTWNGVRFIRTNRLRLRNAGAVIQQTTLTAPTVGGQGAAATVDSVYSVGQTGSTRTIPVASLTGLAVGMYVTFSDQAAHAGGTPPPESDGSQETRRIVATGALTITVDKPLLKPHASGDFVTKGIDIHTSVFMGGPAVVMAIGERPNVIMPPKYDDLMMVNRIGWRAFMKLQMFRPEYIEVHENAGSTN